MLIYVYSYFLCMAVEDYWRYFYHDSDWKLIDPEGGRVIAEKSVWWDSMEQLNDLAPPNMTPVQVAEFRELARGQGREVPSFQETVTNMTGMANWTDPIYLWTAVKGMVAAARDMESGKLGWSSWEWNVNGFIPEEYQQQGKSCMMVICQVGALLWWIIETVRYLA